MSSNSRDTVVGGWSSPTSTLSRSYCITTVSAYSRINHPYVQPNISPLASDGAGEGKSDLLGISSLLHPDGSFFPPTLQILWMRSHSPIRHSIFGEPDFRIPTPGRVCLSDKPDNRTGCSHFRP